MTSPARLHRERCLAAAGAVQMASAGERTGKAATEYQMMLARLGVDLRRLHDVQSIERKIELKRELLPEYDAWVAGVLEADAGGADEIVTHALIWNVDIGAFPAALDLAEYVLRHKLPLPERFNRTAPTLIAEEIAEAAHKAHGQGQSFDLATLEHVAELVKDEDIFDQVRAKLAKAIGYELARRAPEADADGPAGARRAALEGALVHLRRALALDSGSGVKTRIQQLEKEVAKLSPPAES